MSVIMGIPPIIIIIGMPIAIMLFMASQRSCILDIIAMSVGIIFMTMPSFVISQDILHIIGIMPDIIMGIMLCIMLGIIGIIPGIIMPGIIGMPIMPFIIGIMPGIIGMPIMFGIMLGIMPCIGFCIIGIELMAFMRVLLVHTPGDRPLLAGRGRTFPLL